jgi:hypothetical protein
MRCAHSFAARILLRAEQVRVSSCGAELFSRVTALPGLWMIALGAMGRYRETRQTGVRKEECRRQKAKRGHWNKMHRFASNYVVGVQTGIFAGFPAEVAGASIAEPGEITGAYGKEAIATAQLHPLLQMRGH